MASIDMRKIQSSVSELYIVATRHFLFDFCSFSCCIASCMLYAHHHHHRHYCSVLPLPSVFSKKKFKRHIHIWHRFIAFKLQKYELHIMCTFSKAGMHGTTMTAAAGATQIVRVCLCVHGMGERAKWRNKKKRSGVFEKRLRACFSSVRQPDILHDHQHQRTSIRAGDVYFGARSLNAFQSVILFAQNHVCRADSNVQYAFVSMGIEHGDWTLLFARHFWPLNAGVHTISQNIVSSTSNTCVPFKTDGVHSPRTHYEHWTNMYKLMSELWICVGVAANANSG